MRIAFDKTEAENAVDEMALRADDLPDGGEKIAFCEEMVRFADASRDLYAQYAAREALVEAALWGGVPEKGLVAYTWCLAQFDAHPGEFDEWKLLWRYKWILNLICDFPQIPKEQIYAMLDEMERRYLKGGYGLRAVYVYRHLVEKFWGKREEAIKHYRHSRQLPDDDVSDCRACDTDTEVCFQLYLGDYERAVSLAAPLVEGRRFCRSVPQRTFSRLLVPLLVHLDRRAEAWDYHMRGYAMLSEHNASRLGYASDHLVFLALYGDLEKAATLFEKHYPWSEKNTNVFDRLTFYRAAWLFLEVAAEAGRDQLRLHLPDTFPLYDASGSYETARLKEWFEARARETAKRFDARNENDHVTKEMEALLALKSRATKV
ncbi:MAG: hypothetical protein H7Z38_17960 [Rubrivivax sp.]|nr:hypothetical protein [Pyrinomonadaceae bacterium]